MSACDDGGPRNLDDGTFIRGVVRNASDGSPIKNAKVTFTSDTRDKAEDRTDGAGEFSIEVFARSDKGRIEARKNGYAPSVVSVYLDDGEVAIEVDLEPTN